MSLLVGCGSSRLLDLHRVPSGHLIRVPSSDGCMIGRHVTKLPVLLPYPSIEGGRKITLGFMRIDEGMSWHLNFGATVLPSDQVIEYFPPSSSLIPIVVPLVGKENQSYRWLYTQRFMASSKLVFSRLYSNRHGR
eukprot:scaffold1873_cov394-Pavlova_lutheri.AAC.1